MADGNNKDRKGFAGLSDLASDVRGSCIDEPEPKAHTTSSAPKQPPQSQRETTSSEPERHATSSPSSIATVTSGKSDGSSGGKWILGVLGIVFVIWMISNGGQSNKKSSYNPPSSSQSSNYPQSSLTTTVTTPSVTQNTGLQYSKPSVGTNNVLSVPEIQWCIREGIRIKAMRDIADTNTEIDEFNRIVNDYNIRCGNYRYRKGSQSQAERNVEPYRSQIVAEAIREAKQLGRPYQSSYAPVSPNSSTSIVPGKPSAQDTREAQQLLTDLGYKPGPVDGDYGSQTADAVKAFQRKVGITQDGRIDEGLLNMLRRMKTEHKPPVVSQPQSQTSLAAVQKAAEQGDAKAQRRLAWAYHHGEGVQKDASKAVEWFQKAAEQGDAEAQCRLGVAYHYGLGIQKDTRKALEWFQKAAKQGHTLAQSMLREKYPNLGIR